MPVELHVGRRGVGIESHSSAHLMTTHFDLIDWILDKDLDSISLLRFILVLEAIIVADPRAVLS